jgi:hypothetical protein
MVMATHSGTTDPKTTSSVQYSVPAVPGVLAALAALIMGASGPSIERPAVPDPGARRLAMAKVYFEFNSSANDLGVHVLLDGEDWATLTIVNPQGDTIFEVEGQGAYSQLGLTELFFEGAEPSLDEFPLDELLGLFPEGRYAFSGQTVDGGSVRGTAVLSHSIPAGPVVSTVVGPGENLILSWEAAGGPPDGFPGEPVNVVGYQVIVGTFQVTLPATTFAVTLPPEFVASLASGEHPFEVLAIEAGGNQTITEGTFVAP